MPRLSANLSLLFGGLPLSERFAAARAAGYAGVESWWPWAIADPGAAVIDDFLQHASDAGTALRALNLWAGDMPAGERGVLNDPARAADFRENVRLVREIAQRSGCRAFNALYGRGVVDVDIAEQRRTAIDNLRFAARELAPIDGVVLLEALKSPENGDYPLRTLDDAEALRAEVGEPNVALLVDTFHLAGNGVDLPAGIAAHAAHIGHVQIADFPGRGAPGTGEIDFAAVVDALDSADYDGWVGAEFIPGDRVPSPSELLAMLEPVR